MNKKISTFLFLSIFILTGMNAQVIFSEGFENGDLPTDFTITTNSTDGGWIVGSASTLSSAYWPVEDNGTSNIIASNDDACNCDKSEDYLILPVVDMTNIMGLVLDVDVFFGAQTYQGSTEVGTVEVSTDNMTTWTVVQTLEGNGDWTNHIVNLSNYAGESSVHIAFHYNDDGGWVYGFALDNINLVIPPDLDAELKDLDAKPFAELTDELPIQGSIINTGVNTIESLEISYTVNSGAPVVDNLTGLSIESAEIYEFILPTIWVPTAEGVYNVEVEILNVNGMADENPDNNKLDFELEIFPKITRPNIIDNILNTIPEITQINTGADLLDKPTDLDFFPVLAKNELWVINQRIEADGGSTTTFYDVGETDQSSWNRVDGNAWHFMSLPTGIAFGDNGFFANSPGVQDANHGGGTFTGPSLWESDPEIYAQPSGGNGSHMDMLHGSPYSMGIAHETGNAYWVFDGWNTEIVRYDFVEDHGPGNDDHSDGIVRRVKDFTVTRDGDIPSHLVVDKSTGWLYIVDNGSDRVLRLDINSGNMGTTLALINEPLAEHSSLVNTDWEVIIENDLVRPSGIEVIGNRLLVSDYDNGDIIVYDMDNGFGELGRIATGAAGITGITIGPDGNIWYVNRINNSLMKVEEGAPVSNENIVKNSSLKISPNPTSGIVNITLDIPSVNDNLQFNLFDITGRIIQNGEINGTQHQLDLSNLSKGTYTLGVYNNEFTFFKKIILQ